MHHCSPFRTQLIYIRREIPTRVEEEKGLPVFKGSAGGGVKNALLHFLPASQIALSHFPFVIQNPHERISPEVSQI